MSNSGHTATLFYVTTGIAVIIVALAVAYNLVIFQPAKQKAEQDAANAAAEQRQKDAGIKALGDFARQQNQDQCIEDVNVRYRNAMKSDDTKNLSTSDLKVLLDVLQQQKDECYKRYPTQ